MSHEEKRDFHFNANSQSKTGPITRMAINEAPFHRAMEIQERKREKIEDELKRLEAEKQIEEPTASEIASESVENGEVSPTAEAVDSKDSPETQVTQSEVAVVPETKAETPAPAPEPSGGGVPKPKPRTDFTPEEKDAMVKRAKAHAAEVRARKQKNE